MKKNIIVVTVIIVLGALIALGPLFVFRICDPVTMDGEVEITCCGPSGYPRCQWTAQAEIGIGLLVIALGACMLVFDDAKTRLGLAVTVSLASLAALAFPYFLIGGCPAPDMACHKTAFPAIAVESMVLFVFSASIAAFILMKNPSVRAIIKIRG